MAVFEYGDQSDDETEISSNDQLEDIIDNISPIDEDVKIVSVVDQGTGEYSYLRQGIPGQFADSMGISGGDDVLIKQVGDALIVINP